MGPWIHLWSSQQKPKHLLSDFSVEWTRLIKCYTWQENNLTLQNYTAIKMWILGTKKCLKLCLNCLLWTYTDTCDAFKYRSRSDSEREKSKLRVSVFLLNKPKLEFSIGYFHRALWLYAPVAAHAHHVLLVYTLALPLCDPDSAHQPHKQTNYCVSKLLSPVCQTFSLISAPFPEEASVY